MLDMTIVISRPKNPSFYEKREGLVYKSMHVCDISVERIYLHVHGLAKGHLTLESSNSLQVSGKVPTVASECGIQPIYIALNDKQKCAILCEQLVVG